MNKWDKKANSYNRYSLDKGRFEYTVLEYIKEANVSFADKNVIDIGCGTGVYTLHVAKKALQVDALDSSKEMLQILQKDANYYGIESIQTHFTSWQEYALPQSLYDIALCTMSPAVSDEAHIKKMHECARQKIYLGWAGKRESTILDTIFQAHGKKYEAPNGSLRLKNWLKSENIWYISKEIQETKKSTRDLKDSIENFAWHLEIRGATPDKQLIRKLLLNFCDEDGNITEITKSTFNLIIW